MELISIILTTVTLVSVIAVIPYFKNALNASKQNLDLYDFEKVKLYVELMDEKHILESEMLRKKFGENASQYIKRLVENKQKLMNDYQNLLKEITEELRALDVPDKDAYIKQHYPSHYDFFCITVLGK